MDLQHKIKHQVNFTNLKPSPVPEVPINRPVILMNKRFKQQFGVRSAASGEREIRMFNDKK